MTLESIDSRELFAVTEIVGADVTSFCAVIISTNCCVCKGAFTTSNIFTKWIDSSVTVWETINSICREIGLETADAFALETFSSAPHGVSITICCRAFRAEKIWCVVANVLGSLCNVWITSSKVNFVVRVVKSDATLLKTVIKLASFSCCILAFVVSTRETTEPIWWIKNIVATIASADWTRRSRAVVGSWKISGTTFNDVLPRRSTANRQESRETLIRCASFCSNGCWVHYATWFVVGVTRHAVIFLLHRCLNIARVERTLQAIWFRSIAIGCALNCRWTTTLKNSTSWVEDWNTSLGLIEAFAIFVFRSIFITRVTTTFFADQPILYRERDSIAEIVLTNETIRCLIVVGCASCCALINCTIAFCFALTVDSNIAASIQTIFRVSRIIRIEAFNTLAFQTFRSSSLYVFVTKLSRAFSARQVTAVVTNLSSNVSGINKAISKNYFVFCWN